MNYAYHFLGISQRARGTRKRVRGLHRRCVGQRRPCGYGLRGLAHPHREGEQAL
jgi:hypothetical protein